jgi:membrane protease YdiL (CAAX protease family)
MGQTKSKLIDFSAAGFTFKQAALLCLFLLGLWGAAAFLLRLIGLRIFTLLDSIILLAATLVAVKQAGTGMLTKILAPRGVPAQVFFSLIVMYLGFEILNSELLNLWAHVIPIPEGFFGSGGRASFGSIVIALITQSLFPAFTEEIFFRGVLLDKLSKTYPARKAILMSALLFGMMHFNPWQFLNASIGGIFYGWLYLRFRSIWVCMFMHAYNNALALFFPIPYRQYAGEKYAPTGLHEPWFDILGLVLFLAGLGLTLGNMLYYRRKVKKDSSLPCN